MRSELRFGLRVVVVVACLLCVGAAGAGEPAATSMPAATGSRTKTSKILALSDWRQISRDTDLMNDLERMIRLNAAPAASDPAAVAAGVDLVIAQMKKNLAEMKPDDPTAATVRQSIAQLEERQRELKKAAPPPAAPTSAPAAEPKGLPTFAQALGSIRQGLKESATAQALAAFDASDAARDANKAARLAAQALAHKAPVAAVAALLAAHDKEPENPAHLINLAAVVAALGRGEEALALLDQAEKLKGPLPSPMGFNGKALLLNARGYALLQAGRPAEAEAVLRQAIALEPLLAEAKANLAWALAEQGKKQEAVRYLAASIRRTPESPEDPPPQVKQDPTVAKTDPADPKTNPPAAADEGKAPAPRFRPAHDLYDILRGVKGHLPDLKIPMNVLDYHSMRPVYEKVEKAAAARHLALDKRESELGDANQKLYFKLCDEMPRRGLWWSIYQRDFDILIRLFDLYWDNPRPIIESPFHEPELKPLRAKLNAAVYSYAEPYAGVHWCRTVGDNVKGETFTITGRYHKKMNELEEQYHAESRALKGVPAGKKLDDAMKAMDEKYRKLRCQATVDAYAQWRAAMHSVDTAVRVYHEQAYFMMSGLVEQISTPGMREEGRLFIRKASEANYKALLYDAMSFWFNVYDFTEPPGKAEDLDPLECADAKEGEPWWAALSVSVKLSELFNFEINSQGVKVGVGTPEIWGPFAEAEYKFKRGPRRIGKDPALKEYGHKDAFDGELTLIAGPKVGLNTETMPGLSEVEIEAKAGIYVTVNGAGDVTDVGIRAETEVGVGVTPVTVKLETSKWDLYHFAPAAR